MISKSDFRRGLTMRIKGEIFVVKDFQHVNPGKGQAFIKTKLKSISSGKVVDNSFRLSDNIDIVRVEDQQMQYLYKDDTYYYFMNNETYEQFPMSEDMVGDDAKFLKEGLVCVVKVYEENPISLELPAQVEFEVKYAEPSVKGNTATNHTKPVEIETGASIMVPQFINEGDKIIVDTEKGSYISRA